jgi:hypothetical protein
MPVGIAIAVVDAGEGWDAGKDAAPPALLVGRGAGFGGGAKTGALEPVDGRETLSQATAPRQITRARLARGHPRHARWLPSRIHRR